MKNRPITVNLRPAERNILENLANAAGVSMSTYIRVVLLADFARASKLDIETIVEALAS